MDAQFYGWKHPSEAFGNVAHEKKKTNTQTNNIIFQ